ncbi:MAG TPA: type 4a pilus biogenesis protein PilO [Pseudomonadales bacterium]|nr:type 4a pilus biogenesis protein PilO [Pseudomonadales bacterium]
MTVQEFIASLNNLDPENVGSWPLPVKIMVWLFVAVFAGGVVYYLALADSLDTLSRERDQEQVLLKDYESKAFQAANLDKYKEQMKEMETSFGALLRQLPGDTEVPGLLEDISHTGLGSGLEFESIALQDEKVVEFYAELPIQIKVRGGYHSMGTFVSGVSALPRIVTLHDFTIEMDPKRGDLEMNVLAKTYRYNNDDKPKPKAAPAKVNAPGQAGGAK